jgi:hypothetical protein
MPLVTVYSDEVRLDQATRYEGLIQEVAQAAFEKKDQWNWTAHQVSFGNVGTFHYVAEAPDWATIQRRGEVDDLIRRVLGENRGNEVVQQLNECLVSSRRTISVDRPDLSYPPEEERRTSPRAMVTVVRARPGKQEACEEVIRKIAEAIPKAGDRTRLATFQTLVGDGLQYWTLRPAENLSEFDDRLLVPDLLNKAFGTAEGGLIFRSGLEAIESLRREIVRHREDLSNPS